MKRTLLVGCFLALAALSSASAADCIKNQNGDVVCGKGQCAIDQYGKVFCAKEGGGALKDQYGNVKCGLGYCAVDDMGQVQCSTQPGGSAATDSYGKVKCLGSCQAASQQFCEAAAKAPLRRSVQGSRDFLGCGLGIRNDAAHLQKTVHHALGTDVMHRNSRTLRRCAYPSASSRSVSYSRR
jgi:opacity protein-like surface antigen